MPWEIVIRVDLYAREGNWEQAIVVYSQMITPETKDASPLMNRAKAYEATNQWDLAKADWLRVCELEPGLFWNTFHRFCHAEQWKTAVEFGQRQVTRSPDNPNYWPHLAAAIIHSGDEMGYAEFCRALKKKSLKDPMSMEKAILSNLLLAGEVDLADLPVAEFVESAESAKLPKSNAAWGWRTRALLAYRSGDPESAIRSISQSEKLQPPEYLRAVNLPILAMAQYKMHHPDEAKSSLVAASQLISRLKVERYDSSLSVAELLLREAEALIEGKKKPQPASKPKP